MNGALCQFNFVPNRSGSDGESTDNRRERRVKWMRRRRKYTETQFKSQVKVANDAIDIDIDTHDDGSRRRRIHRRIVAVAVVAAMTAKLSNETRK